ncbi:MAG: hypothetical protein D6785_04745 [Planctomycetota bacterium]|nr:MAG: hypothetical protein D6785_04745 [Planctomycetota bacterium]
MGFQQCDVALALLRCETKKFHIAWHKLLLKEEKLPSSIRFKKVCFFFLLFPPLSFSLSSP